MSGEISTVPVNIQNWPDKWAKRPQIGRTTFKTYMLDPAAIANAGGPVIMAQISEFEAKRVRLVVQVIDAAITIDNNAPNKSPDPSAGVGTVTQGRYLPPSLNYDYCFYGPDAFWINSVTAATRVTVTKEYEGQD